MNYFDIVVGGILIFAVVKGFRNGLIFELAILVALVIGIFGAVKFSGFTEVWLSQLFQSQYIGVISFFVTFLGIVIGVHLLAKALDKVVQAIALGMVNRMLGVAFSLLKYAFIISVLLSVFNSFDNTFEIIPPDIKQNSVLYAPLSRLVPSIFPYLNFEEMPQEIQNSIGIEV